VRLEKAVQLIEHDARTDVNAAIVDVEIVDLSIVAREIDDQSFSDGVADETRPGPAWCDRNIFISCSFDDCARFLGAGRKRNAERLDLINRRVRRVKLAREIIEPHIAARSADSFLNGRADHFAANLTQE